MKLVKKLSATLAVAGLAGGMALGTGTIAQATEVKTKTVAWVVTSGSFDNRFGSAQTLFTGTIGSCGQPPLQVDLWKYYTPEERALADSIISKGTLSQTASGPEDQTLYLGSQDIPATPACETTPTPTPTPVETTPAPTETPSPTPTPVQTTPAPEPTPVKTTPAAVIPPKVTPTPRATPSQTATAGPQVQAASAVVEDDTLAYTGTSGTIAKIATAVGLIVAGLAVLFRNKLASHFRRASNTIDNAPKE